MQASSMFFVVLAVLSAFGIAWFQYSKKAIPKKLARLLAGLRFFSVLGLLLLLINPQLEKNEFSIEKPMLTVLADNTESIAYLEGQNSLAQVFESLTQDADLQERFQLNSFVFGDKLGAPDSLSFDAQVSDISKALKTIQDTGGTGNEAIVLLTDGNQTLGADYSFLNFRPNITIYPVVIGDTTKVDDLSITNVNVNTYAFLKNKFPVEATVVYSGEERVQKEFTIRLDNTIVYKESLNFSAQDNTKTMNTLIAASRVGVKNLQISIATLTQEKNTANNTRVAAIEVIDEKTKVSLVSDIKHPDLGLFIKSIEANEQRKVTVYKSGMADSQMEETDVFILYQPTNAFKSVFDHIKKSGAGCLIVTGMQTDWRFLSQIAPGVSKTPFGQYEEILPVKNNGFSSFDISALSMEGFPPLNSVLGELSVEGKPDVLAYQNIKGTTLESPLFFIKEDGAKKAYLLGENVWKWRVQTYRNTGSFESFDNFVDQLMLYLTDNQRKERLNVRYERLYGQEVTSVISAAFFDKSYRFVSDASVMISITDEKTATTRSFPMLLTSTNYTADIADLPAGNYSFIVAVENTNYSKKGSFKVLDFALEEQFTSANDEKLLQLAESTGGTLVYKDGVSELTNLLSTDSKYVPIQKTTKIKVSLIDFRWLLLFLVITLAVEWFVLKYNGLL